MPFTQRTIYQTSAANPVRMPSPRIGMRITLMTEYNRPFQKILIWLL